MRKKNNVSGKNAAPSRYSNWIAGHRTFILTTIIVSILTACGLLGYSLGFSHSKQAVAAAEPRVFGSQSDLLAEQENRCAKIEQINLEQELTKAQKEADVLSNSLDQKEEEFQQQQEKIDSLEETILDALMMNLSDVTLSRSSPTVSSYAEKAKELLSLSRKASTFKEMPESETVDISEYEQALQKQLANIPTKKPISGSLTGYGYRVHPVYGYKHFHPAVDMGAPTGTPIKAAGGGRVISATYNSRSGNYVKIDHGNGFVTAYLHCSKLFVQSGERVSKGDVIAAVGSTGTSTTPHLHFEITFYGSPVNPNQIIME
ncbi:MAG: M23 family metallopeptidase [Clostridiaceae bacterium]|nr:M23 family metallopeptidase [Clostridiaceae bacterium]